MTNEEQSRLANFRGMATMNGAQALEFHDLLLKEAVVEKLVPVEVKVKSVEIKKKRGKK